MSVRDYIVCPCGRAEIKDFIEEWHYSHNINGLMSDYCFKLMDSNILIGAMIYGKLAMAGVYKKYGNSPTEVMELRRLCCIDDTPKNTESYFIGKTLRWLKNNTDVMTIISYADLEYGHVGIIYQASNFKLIGKTAPGRIIMFNGKRYHDKTIRTKYKGELKPFARKIKEALQVGMAWYKKTTYKNIYEYKFKRRTKHDKEIK